MYILKGKDCFLAAGKAFDNFDELVNFTKYNQTIIEVIFDEELSLKKIPDGMFAFCTNLRRVVIPSSVEEIGEEAFAFCENLREVVFPAGYNCCIKNIGKGAFKYCESLKIIELPHLITRIMAETFSGCYNLKIVRAFGRYISNIEENAFLNCDNLEKVSLYNRDKNVRINTKAFTGCNKMDIDKVYVSDGVRKERVVFD